MSLFRIARTVIPSINPIAYMSAPTPTRGSGRGRSNRGRGRGRNFFNLARNQPKQPQDESVVSTTANTPRDLSGAATPVSGNSFAELRGRIDQRILDAVPFAEMTEVQAATLPTALTGRDILAQAKTGTGKTLGFLIPSIQVLATLPKKPPTSDISVLVLSPTRELALQIEKEASMLLSNFGGQIGVQHAVGGTNIKSERSRLLKQRKDILVATPGRLIDYLKNNEDGFDMAASLARVKVLVLDEADRMLDMGFRNELEEIFKRLPDPSSRQSLFFSATIPSFVHKVAKLKPDHEFISTLKEEELNTHEHVPQEVKVVEARQCLPLALLTSLGEALRCQGDHKIIVFLPTARATGLAAEVFRTAAKQEPFKRLGEVFEIHSRKSQAARTHTMADFKASKCGMLFSSDVTARGVDVPGITLVVQLGLPSESEQYIHRLGRTARAGKDGRGVLILGDFESFFLQDKEIERLPLKQMDVQALEQQTQVPMSKALELVEDAMNKAPETIRSQAYQAHLGFYKQFMKKLGLNPTSLVAQSNDYAFQTLLWKGELAPPLQAKTVGMMGLKGIKGLNVEGANFKKGHKRKDSPSAQQGRPAPAAGGAARGPGRGPGQA